CASDGIQLLRTIERSYASSTNPAVNFPSFLFRAAAKAVAVYIALLGEKSLTSKFKFLPQVRWLVRPVDG
ncbi:hypothetical protein CCACVL1_23507, partial [Corchorus capsularis]